MRAASKLFARAFCLTAGFATPLATAVQASSSVPALGAEVKNLDAVGSHYPIFKVEKNVHPQNQMVVFTKLDSQCRFELDESKKPVFDVYWLMNRTDFKPTHPLIKAQIHKRLVVAPDFKPQMFEVLIGDLKELNTDLQEPKLKVTANKQSSNCSVEGTLKLGPSDQNQVLKVETIYTEGEGTFQPTVKSVTLKGHLQSSGKPFERIYKAR